MSTMNTGDVSRRIGIPVTSELLTKLGFVPAGKDKRAVLWDQADYPEMCRALGEHIAKQKDVPMQDKPAPTPRKGPSFVRDSKDKGTPASSGSTTGVKSFDDEDEEL